MRKKEILEEIESLEMEIDTLEQRASEVDDLTKSRIRKWVAMITLVKGKLKTVTDHGEAGGDVQELVSVLVLMAQALTDIFQNLAKQWPPTE